MIFLFRLPLPCPFFITIIIFFSYLLVCEFFHVCEHLFVFSDCIIMRPVNQVGCRARAAVQNAASAEITLIFLPFVPSLRRRKREKNCVNFCRGLYGGVSGCSTAVCGTGGRGKQQ
uniref:Uncharacterized protein n=1 Tax=Trypanosoma vivax (strain Y486) TaxID=1055687 RepID=G0TZ91_TRYVY|nr:hypothetical protein TVY486_0706120 [Trypanosoma vivax Y486]